MLNILFENRYSGACKARVALRPARSFFLHRADIPIIAVDIPCPPAAFGVVKIPCAIPLEFQGTRQKFDAGAHVVYAKKGRMLRFRPGLALRGGADFENPFGTAVNPAGLCLGHISIASPASATFQLPVNVRESPEDLGKVQVEVLWKLGDPVPANSMAMGLQGDPAHAKG